MSVIFSPSFVLGAADPYANANNPVIGYHNIVTKDNVSATQLAAFPASNVANPATDLLWNAGAISSINFDVTNTNNETIDYVGIAGHNFASAEIAVKISVNTGSGFVDITSPFMPGTNQPLLFRLPSTLGAITVRITMAAGNAPPQMAVVYVGRLLMIQRRVYVGHTPITMGRSVEVVNGLSESGNFLGSVIIGEVVETQLDLQNLTPSWYREKLDPFIAVGKTTPCFFAWRPQTYPHEVGYCWIINDPRPSNQRSNGMMELSINFRGIA